MAKDGWDKTHIIIGLLVPVVIAYFGYEINSSIQEKGLQQKYIEIAVGILNSDPLKKENEPLRDWAIDVLEKYSPIKISPAAIKALKEQRLPVTVLLSGISAQAQTGQPKGTNSPGNGPETASAKSTGGAGSKARTGQVTGTVE